MDKIFAFISAFFISIFPNLSGDVAPVYNGYIEANYVYIASNSPGRIEQLAVSEGQEVSKGELLFLLENDKETANLHSAIAREQVAKANWQNLETGSRKEEIAVLSASLEQAQATHNLAASTFERTKKLKQQGLVSSAQLDEIRTKFESANAKVKKLKAQLSVAQLPARNEQLLGAKAAYEAAQFDAERAKIELANRTIFAPVSGRIERVYFWQGEVAIIGRPVVAILPPQQLFAKFFLPETDRMKFSIGDVLSLECDGCKEGLSATITFMASSPQHTPPIIYSKDERSRLVFMAKASLNENFDILPGQPISLSDFNE